MLTPQEIEELDRLLLQSPTSLDVEVPPEWFHQGQFEAWAKSERYILLLAGLQSGKTVFGPPWLKREIKLVWERCKQNGHPFPTDYAVIGPTYTLLAKNAMPKMLAALKGLGSFVKSPIPMFTFSDEGARSLIGEVPQQPIIIYFLHASDPDALESMTLGAVWCDEAGQQKFKKGSWTAITGRISSTGGRVLFTTTPYEWHWLKFDIYDRWLAKDTDIAVVSFETIMNPIQDAGDFEKQRQRMPEWEFDMRYRGKFTRPAGMIYDCWARDKTTCPAFPIPAKWRRLSGHDFGNVHTAAVVGAQNPKTGVVYLYCSYLDGSKTTTEHAAAIMQNAGLAVPATAFGGAPSEDKWREDYANVGYPIQKPPVRDVEEGIKRVYSLLKRGLLVVFDNLSKVMIEFETYSRELNENSEPTLGILNKETFHRLDCIRYLASALYEGLDDEFDEDREPESRFESTEPELKSSRITREDRARAAMSEY